MGEERDRKIHWENQLGGLRVNAAFEKIFSTNTKGGEKQGKKTWTCDEKNRAPLSERGDG